METNEQGLKYAGFWRRLGAHLIDTVIFLVPMFAIRHLFSAGSLKYANLSWCILSVFISLWYHLFLQVKYGGTPGLRLMKTKIRKLDGSAATFREVALRFSPMLVFTVLSTYSNIQIYSQMSDSDFLVSSQEQSRLITQYAPSWTFVLVMIMGIWEWSEFLVMMLNKKRRAIHDFIAGTVMLQDPAPTLADEKTDFIG